MRRRELILGVTGGMGALSGCLEVFSNPSESRHSPPISVENNTNEGIEVTVYVESNNNGQFETTNVVTEGDEWTINNGLYAFEDGHCTIRIKHDNNEEFEHVGCGSTSLGGLSATITTDEIDIGVSKV